MITEEVRNSVYQAIIDDLPEKRRIVFQAIKNIGKATIKDIQGLTKWPKNSISGRITELRQLFMIKPVATEDGNLKSDQYTVYEIVTNDQERLDMMRGWLRDAEEKQDNLSQDLNETISADGYRVISKDLEKLKDRIRKVKELCELQES